MKVLLFNIILFLCSIGYSQNEIIGFWHASPHVASGYSAYFAFYDNNNFQFATNSMDCDQRLTSYSGIYTVTDDTIALNIMEFIVLLDGKAILDETSCYNGYYLEGAEELRIYSNKDIIRKHKLDFCKYIEEDITFNCLIIGGLKYYKLCESIEDYIKE